MDNIKELVSKYRWWIVGVAVVALVIWNNYGVAEAEAAATDASMETTHDGKDKRDAYKATQRAKRAERAGN